MPRAARRNHGAESALRDALQDGEHVQFTCGVGTGSLVAYTAVATAIGLASLGLIFRDGGPSTLGDWLVRLILFAAINIPTLALTEKLIFRTRELVLTDRRMLLCRVGWGIHLTSFSGKVVAIDEQEPREDLQLLWKDKDRPVFIGRDGKRFSLRLRFPYGSVSSAIEGWVEPSSN
jgi:hypothetical protein